MMLVRSSSMLDEEDFLSLNCWTEIYENYSKFIKTLISLIVWPRLGFKILSLLYPVKGNPLCVSLLVVPC